MIDSLMRRCGVLRNRWSTTQGERAHCDASQLHITTAIDKAGFFAGSKIWVYLVCRQILEFGFLDTKFKNKTQGFG